ncbi:MAG: DEAD/DEAH box helicase [Candidatus Aenigmatarchaeota archaeon]
MQSLIKEKGFLEPTLPQRLGIPEILSGKSVLIIAPTGIGKTEACILPLFDKIYHDRNKPIAILYITPMRALNRDLLERLFWWADKLDLDISVRHGDTTQRERAEQREFPSHLLITTPETLAAILPGKKIREHLRNVKHVVIDEVHELVENKRGVQLSILLERLKVIAGDFQRIGLSATIGEPKKVAQFIGRNVSIVNAETAKKYEISVELPKTKPGKLAEFMSEDTEARLLRIKELVDRHKNTLIFTNTRETAEVLASRFKLLDKEFAIDVHHGSLSKSLRIKSEQMFKKDMLRALIATSSLELGIDIGSIDLVIQYLSPRRIGRFIQRVGRSGHRVGETSKGIIISDEEDVFESAVIARRAMEKEIEKINIHDLALDILANQIIGLSLDKYNISIDEAFNIIKNAYPYRNLSKEKFLDLLGFLKNIRLIWLTDNGELRRNRKSWQYYYENLSSIPDVKKIKVINMINNEAIGFLDEGFVAEHGELGNTFICSGRAWKIVQIESNKVLVEPVEDIESAIPAWEGELIPVSFLVAQDVGKMRREVYENIKNIDYLMDKYPIDENSAKSIINLIRRQSKRHIIPDHETILIENYRDFIILHSCYGTLVNNTIGKYLAARLTMETGASVNLKTDAYRIILQTLSSPENIKKILLNAEDIEKTIEVAMERSSLFKWQFLYIAKRFGVISKDASLENIRISKIISQYLDTPLYEETMRTIFLEKMDIKTTKEILHKISSGKIKIVIENGLSPLGENGLKRQFFDAIKPKKPEREIFEAFKKRLMSTRLRLVCVNCCDYSISIEVRDMEDQPMCPKCHSRLLGIFNKPKEDPLRLLKKPTKEEKKYIKTLRRSASLMITYGKKYAMVQAGRGIGVETAARILAKLPKDEDQLLKYIFDAEKSFARTHKYWRQQTF